MPRKRVIWTEAASESMSRILSYYEKQNGSSAYSNKLYAAFRRKLRNVSRGLKDGDRTDYPGIKMIFTDNTSVYYRKAEGNVEVVAVCDARRDPETRPF